MCVGDYRLGRLIRSVVRSVNTSATASTTILASPQRVGIIFGISENAFINTRSVGITVDGFDGFHISGNHPYLAFNMLEHGDLPTRKFVVSSLGSTAIFICVEQFLPEEALNIPLEDILRSYNSWNQ
jgi:hypothetical protein